MKSRVRLLRWRPCKWILKQTHPLAVELKRKIGFWCMRSTSWRKSSVKKKRLQAFLEAFERYGSSISSDSECYCPGAWYKNCVNRFMCPSAKIKVFPSRLVSGLGILDDLEDVYDQSISTGLFGGQNCQGIVLYVNNRILKRIPNWIDSQWLVDLLISRYSVPRNEKKLDDKGSIYKCIIHVWG